MEDTSLNKPRYRWWELGALYCLWLGVFFYTLYIAWVSEDAYITFRVIENFFDGYGLRWNIHERVQAYTHPLWMLIHLPVYALWKNVYLTNVAISVVCTSAAVLVMMFAGRRSVPMSLVFLFLPLAASQSFTDYSTSGLENPLSYLLFAAFCYVVMRKHEHPLFWFYCSLTIALSLFNRLDTALLYAPAFFCLMRQHKPVRWAQIAWGMTPLIAWFYFSFFYYGFLFPNTKYAKLGTDMSLWLYLSQGLHYTKYLLIWDTAGAIVIASCILFLLPKWLTRWVNPPPGLSLLPTCMAVGVLLYALYVVYIGGDYMAGRFWALPVFAGICIWFLFLPERLRPDIIFLCACILITSSYTPRLLEDIRKSCSSCIPLKGRVIHARFVFSRNKLIVKPWPVKFRRQGHYPFAEGGRKLKKESPAVKKLFYVGMTPYYAGPEIKIIDELGLADPLLARLPASKKQRFYIGHFRRDLPEGYAYAVRTGSLDKMPADLARYYDRLRLITSGNLLDKERLKTIVLFNIGYYDHWKREYLSNLAKQPEKKPDKPK